MLGPVRCVLAGAGHHVRDGAATLAAGEVRPRAGAHDGQGHGEDCRGAPPLLSHPCSRPHRLPCSGRGSGQEARGPTHHDAVWQWPALQRGTDHVADSGSRPFWGTRCTRSCTGCTRLLRSSWRGAQWSSARQAVPACSCPCQPSLPQLSVFCVGGLYLIFHP